MITHVLLIGASLVLLISGANALDCKKVDEKKFKEIFEFKYTGGQKGLKLDFNFVSDKNKKFKIENCEFELKETKWKEIGKPKMNTMKEPKSLGGLSPCNKYEIELLIINPVSKAKMKYKNFVFTKHDAKLTQIKLQKDNITSDSIDLSWKISGGSSCITKVTVEISSDVNGTITKDVDINDRKLSVTDLSSCVEYKASVVAATGRDESISSQSVSFIPEGEITINTLDLKIVEVKSDAVELSWESDSTQCRPNYQINLRSSDDSKIVREKNVFENAAVISDLNSCNNYSVELIALSSENVSLKAVSKSFMTRSAPIANVTVTKRKTKLDEVKITWKAPQKLSCIANYVLEVSEEDCNETNNNSNPCFNQTIISKTETSFTLKNLTFFQRYTMKFYANESTSRGDSVSVENISFNTIDYDLIKVENVNEMRINRTELLLSWNNQDIFDVKLLSHYDVFFEESRLTTKTSKIVLPIAACKKNYTVLIRFVWRDGYESSNFTYHTKLNDDDIPLHLDEDQTRFEHGNKSVTVSWAPKAEEVECVDHYEISFNDEIITTKETRTTITDFAPCILYEIAVTPVSHHDFRGRTSIFEFTTQELDPQSPTSLKLTNAGNKDLTLAVQVSDEDRQCNTTVIEFNCDGNLATINVNPQLSENSAKIADLSPFTTYNCSARVGNTNGWSESTEVQMFTTNQEAPQTPYNISTTVNDDRSVEVTWNVNATKGVVTTFKVFVSLDSRNFKQPLQCRSAAKEKFTYEAREARIVLKELEAFSKYSLEVMAENKAGKSAKSEKHHFMTAPASASAPRNLGIMFPNLDENSPQVDGIVTWDVPCSLNGRLSHYVVTLDGKRVGYAQDVRTEGSGYGNITISNLSRAYEYEVKIQAWSSDLPGEFAKLSFRVPTGVPLEEDLENWTPLEATSNQALFGHHEIYIRRGIFNSSMGEITGIVFLIFLKNCPDLPQPTNSLSTALSDGLPSAYKNRHDLMCSQLYQQSDFIPNPLNLNDDNSMDEFTTKFTIGDEDCDYVTSSEDYCNGPLPANHYGLMARIFTKSGFRDSEPVYFEISSGSLAALISPEHIVIGTVIFCVLTSLIIFILCLHCCKKKKQSKKEKEAAEADENLLSFTSYCVLDRNPKKPYE